MSLPSQLFGSGSAGSHAQGLNQYPTQLGAYVGGAMAGMQNALTPVPPPATMREQIANTWIRIERLRRDLAAAEVEVLKLVELDNALTDEYGPESTT